MTLITILIALLIEKYANLHAKFRDTRWFCNYINWINKIFSEHKWMNGPAGVLIIIAPATAAVGAVFSILDGYHSIYSFIFSILILSFSIGPNKFYDDVTKFIRLKKHGDNEGALWCLDKILGRDLPESEPLLILKLTKAILVQTSKRLLAVLFWFVVLGPVGAILYRLSNVMHDDKIENKEDSPFASAAAHLQFILHWIPSRLTSLSFAISGSFVHASDCWSNTTSDTTDDSSVKDQPYKDNNEELLTCIGISALQLGETELNLDSITETLKMCLRAVIVWVTVIAIMTLAGWMI